MNRYDHALNKKPKIQIEKVQSFGFDELNEVTVNLLKSSFKKISYFRLEPKETARIGIVYSDHRKIFTGTFVHFHKTYFLCKSTKDKKAICCNKCINRTYRIACVIIQYFLEKKTWRIIPWCFGKILYKKLNDINVHYPIQDHDYFVKRTSDTIPIYDLIPAEASLWRLWQKSENKEEIIIKAEEVRENIKNVLGNDLSIREIEDLLDS